MRGIACTQCLFLRSHILYTLSATRVHYMMMGLTSPLIHNQIRGCNLERFEREEGCGTTLTEIRDHNLLRGRCRENEWEEREEERVRVVNRRENTNGWWVWQPTKDLCLKLWRGFFQ